MVHRLFTALWLTGAACATAAIATDAHAGRIRYISTTGSDVDPCTLAQPCKTLQRGINQTPGRGELRILDSGDYGGNGKIRKSITISGNGNTVAIAKPIIIDKANATVVLRGLTLNGRDSAGVGIEVFAAAAVHIARCAVQDFPGHGIRLYAANSNLSISDSVVRNNGTHGLLADSNTATVTVDNSLFQNNTAHGIIINGARVAINRTVIARNATGVGLVSSARVAIAQSLVAHNSGNGIDSAATRLTIESSIVQNNSSGVIAQPNSTVVIANSAFVNNINGIFNNGGTILTRGNNTASGNINADTAGTLTALPGV